MEIKEGYVYHIKSDYFEIVKDSNLMKNHEGNSTRPIYTDGRLAPCWGYQIDETASVIYGVYMHYLYK